MSVQRKLNALLFELQTAQSPLAQAKILARSWRTLRELSATDRRLLARHAGFDGAEYILEGLAKKKSGFAPATLLQVLNNARSTDGSSVTELLAAIQDPSRRDEAISRGAELAQELLVETDAEDDLQEIGEALDQLHSMEEVVQETPEEALAALSALKTEAAKAQPPAQARVRPEPDEPRQTESSAVDGGEKPDQSPAAPAAPASKQEKPEPAVIQRRAPVVAPLPGWERLGKSRLPSEREPEPVTKKPSTRAPMLPPTDAPSESGGLGETASPLTRLRALDHEMNRLRRSGPASLRAVLEEFPDGWVRRRALLAMIGAGVPSDARQALELMALLEREVDRRWCLGALAQRGDLEGILLQESLELVTSEAGRRRLRIIAERAEVIRPAGRGFSTTPGISDRIEWDPNRDRTPTSPLTATPASRGPFRSS